MEHKHAAKHNCNFLTMLNIMSHMIQIPLIAKTNIIFVKKVIYNNILGISNQYIILCNIK